MKNPQKYFAWYISKSTAVFFNVLNSLNEVNQGTLFPIFD